MWLCDLWESQLALLTLALSIFSWRATPSVMIPWFMEYLCVMSAVSSWHAGSQVLQARSISLWSTHFFLFFPLPWLSPVDLASRTITGCSEWKYVRAKFSPASVVGRFPVARSHLNLSSSSAERLLSDSITIQRLPVFFFDKVSRLFWPTFSSRFFSSNFHRIPSCDRWKSWRTPEEATASRDQLMIIREPRDDEVQTVRTPNKWLPGRETYGRSRSECRSNALAILWLPWTSINGRGQWVESARTRRNGKRTFEKMKLDERIIRKSLPEKRDQE